MIELSIVFGTYNRLDYLKRTMKSLGYGTCGYPYKAEIIIVDGGSNDGTVEYLKSVGIIKYKDQGGLLGCVDAYNKGFALTRGEYVAFLNDDITVENDALVQSCEMLDNNPDIGMVAIPYENPGRPRQVAYCNAGNPSKKYLFACFGVLRRELGEAAGWFDGFYHYCGDSHLAMSIWKMGYRVEELKSGGYIKHYDAPSPVKNHDPELRGRIKNDWRLWSEKWGSWDHVPDVGNKVSFASTKELPEE